MEIEIKKMRHLKITAVSVIVGAQGTIGWYVGWLVGWLVGFFMAYQPW